MRTFNIKQKKDTSSDTHTFIEKAEDLRRTNATFRTREDDERLALADG